MGFGFDELVVNVVYLCSLLVGIVVGGGIVLNLNYCEVGLFCIVEWCGIEMLDMGLVQIEFMCFGDSVKMEVFMNDGLFVFGIFK